MGLFKKKKDFLHIEVRQLIEWNEPNGEGCVVSDKITKEGYKVGYMFKNPLMETYEVVGRWIFLHLFQKKRKKKFHLNYV